MRSESKFPTNNSKGYGYVGIEFIRPGTIQSRRVSASDPPAIVHIIFSLPLSLRGLITLQPMLRKWMLLFGLLPACALYGASRNLGIDWIDAEGGTATLIGR